MPLPLPFRVSDERGEAAAASESESGGSCGLRLLLLLLLLLSPLRGLTAAIFGESSVSLSLLLFLPKGKKESGPVPPPPF